MEQVVLGLLQKGQECEDKAQQLVDQAGDKGIDDKVVIACLGNRQQKIASCPKTLQVLLSGGANPNATDPQTQGPVLHTAAWHDALEVVKTLLDSKADIDRNEPRMKTPPLNTAIAAGSAKVCLELLNRNADVQWLHHDGASALHVATAWIASSHNAQLRLPPVGEQPRAVIAMMLHNGVDPTITEGMSKKGIGLTPLQGFLQEVAHSPWRMDPNIGPKFDQTARNVHTLLEQAEKAVRLKQKGNKAFSAADYTEAKAAYAEARTVWDVANIRGHHSAVLWSNEAKCAMKEEQWELAQQCCAEGLQHYCTKKIMDKLEDSAALAQAEHAAAAKPKPEVAQIMPDAAEAAPAEGLVKAKSAKRSGFKFPKGCLDDGEAEPFYPNGSEQGKEGEAGNRPFICDYREADVRGFQYEEMRRMKEKQDEMLDGGASARAAAAVREARYICDGYCWSQTQTELEIRVERTCETPPSVTINTRRLQIQPDSTAPPTVAGELSAIVKMGDSTWTLDNDGTVVVTLTKSIPGQWENVFKKRD